MYLLKLKMILLLLLVHIFEDTWHLCLLSGSSVFGFAVTLLTGIQTKDLTNNPLFGSSSPSDFWGRRWNNVVHKTLKVRFSVPTLLFSTDNNIYMRFFGNQQGSTLIYHIISSLNTLSGCYIQTNDSKHKSCIYCHCCIFMFWIYA